MTKCTLCTEKLLVVVCGYAVHSCRTAGSWCRLLHKTSLTTGECAHANVQNILVPWMCRVTAQVHILMEELWHKTSSIIKYNELGWIRKNGTLYYWCEYWCEVHQAVLTPVSRVTTTCTTADVKRKPRNMRKLTNAACSIFAIALPLTPAVLTSLQCRCIRHLLVTSVMARFL